MPRTEYRKWKPSSATKPLLNVALTILHDYHDRGYNLTVRQLYYQIVARDLIPNNKGSYNKLVNLVQNARDAGIIDWDFITDRTRSLEQFPKWEDASHFMRSVAPQFHEDWWGGQPQRCQVWVEKEALSEVVATAADRWDVPYLSCKGYSSASAVWEAAQFMRRSECDDWIILHLGDHDPSGIDMTRDIQERLELYCTPTQSDDRTAYVKVKRIALNMEQIQEYNPPPNFAKTVDPRFKEYERLFGDESWELDAIDPDDLVTLIEREIEDCLLDIDSMEEIKSREKRTISKLKKLKV